MRYMKRIICSFLPLFMALGVTSCQKEAGRLGTPADQSAIAPVKVVVSNSLRASGDDSILVPTEALPREKKVSSLYAVAYQEDGVFFNVIKCEPVTGAPETYTFDMKAEGKFQFVLVANPDATLLDKLKTTSAVIGDIDRIVVTQTAGENNQAENFVLTSDRVTVTTKRATEATPTPDVIKLQRLSARFDFLNRVPQLEISKITFNKRMTQSYLYARTDVSALTSTSDKTYTTTEGMEARQCVATIYGYENPNPDETLFTIEGTFNGKEIEPYPIRLENLTIKRNHLYTIIISPLGGNVDPGDPEHGHTSGKLPIRVRVLDWEEGETLSRDNAEVLAANYVDHTATIEGASFMDPYLKHSPAEIYTVSKDATTVNLTVSTFLKPGTLEIKGAKPTGVELADAGVQNGTDGRLIRSYTLTLPKQDKFADVAQYYVMNSQGRDVSSVPYFQDITLVAKGPFGDEVEEFVVHHGRMKTPLEHLAEYTLKGDQEGNPVGFNTTHDVTKQDYFKVIKLSNVFKAGDQKWAHARINYHMPIDQAEWCSIFPETMDQIGANALAKGNKYTHNVASYAIHPRMRFFDVKGDGTVVGAVPFANRSDYANAPNGKIGYALKFKEAKPSQNWQFPTDGSMLVAYRYEWVGNFKTLGVAGPVDTNCHLKVTSRYLGKGWKGTITDVSNEDFWNKDQAQDATRIFPFTGMHTRIPWMPHQGEGVYFPCYKDKYKDADDYWIPVLQLRPDQIGAEGSALSQWDDTGFAIYLFTDAL